MKRILSILFFIICTPLYAEEPLTLYWEELLPEGEIELLDELYATQGSPAFGHSPQDQMMQSTPLQIGTFNVVEELDGKLVRYPGVHSTI